MTSNAYESDTAGEAIVLCAEFKSVHGQACSDMRTGSVSAVASRHPRSRQGKNAASPKSGSTGRAANKHATVPTPSSAQEAQLNQSATATATATEQLTNQQSHPQQHKWYAFGRDVWVNFLANLIAAAFIYLLGRLTGYFKGNPAITSIAVALVTGTMLLASMALTYGRPRILRVGISLVVLYGGAWLALSLDPAVQRQQLWAALVGVGAFISAFGFIIYRSYRKKDLPPIREAWVFYVLVGSLPVYALVLC